METWEKASLLALATRNKEGRRDDNHHTLSAGKKTGLQAWEDKRSDMKTSTEHHGTESSSSQSFESDTSSMSMMHALVTDWVPVADTG